MPTILSSITIELCIHPLPLMCKMTIWLQHLRAAHRDHTGPELQTARDWCHLIILSEKRIKWEKWIKCTKLFRKRKVYLQWCMLIFIFLVALSQHQRWEKHFWGTTKPHVFKTTLMLPEDVRNREGVDIMLISWSTQWSTVIRHGPELSQSQSSSPHGPLAWTVRGSLHISKQVNKRSDLMLLDFLCTDTCLSSHGHNAWTGEWN